MQHLCIPKSDYRDWEIFVETNTSDGYDVKILNGKKEFTFTSSDCVVEAMRIALALNAGFMVRKLKQEQDSLGEKAKYTTRYEEITSAIRKNQNTVNHDLTYVFNIVVVSQEEWFATQK
jgi:hypothetical protein